MVLSAWGSEEETPAFRVFPDAFKKIAPRLSENAKPKRITGSPCVLKNLLESAGFVNVDIAGPIERVLRVKSAESYYNRFALGSPNTMSTISQLTQEEQVALKAAVMKLAIVRGGKPDGSIQLPSSAYFAYGSKP